ncbi:MAG: Tol-Pal system beta propeller repeat protein TolB [Mariprofundales bacterium]
MSSLYVTNATAAEFDIYQSNFQPLALAWMMEVDDSVDLSDAALLEKVVINDLQSSASFKALNPLLFLADPKTVWEKPHYADWRIIGTDVLAVCKLSINADGQWEAQLRVHDPFRAKRTSVKRVNAGKGNLRAVAHVIANHIYEASMGIQGHFYTNVLYVRKRGNLSDLIYMAQDGHKAQVVGSNFNLLLSPDISPDNRIVALNTYVGHRSRIELFDLQTGKRKTIAKFRGLNSTPAWSPDGRYIAAALSYTGNSELHLYDIQTGKWRRLTNNTAIDTTPSWSPDGKFIAFTSDRIKDNPQVFKINIANGKVTQISMEGKYNTSPAWSPKGDRIAYISLKNWEFALAVSQIDGSDIHYLATGKRIESPVWSPNAQMLLFSAQDQHGRGVYRIPAWGGVITPITSTTQDASDPVWSH